MIKVKREDIIDYKTYQDTRDAFRKEVMEVKKNRRVHVGKYLTFLFENTLTARYQVQEMMLTEQIVKESDIQHEIDTYNEVLGGQGELGCTLLIEIENEKERAEKLTAWIQLPKHLFMVLEDGTEVPAKYDERQIGDDRLSSVQYLKFEVGAVSPVGFKVTLPGLELDSKLSEVQRIALTEDLRSDL